MTPRTIPLLERFLNTLEESVDLSGCWTWKGVVDGKGYGAIYEGPHTRKYLRAHRVSYEYVYGPIAQGLLVRHKCDNPICVRPDHLELGTQSDNMQDAAKRGRLSLYQLRITHCPKGHEYTPVNTYVRKNRNGARKCRACDRKA